MNYLQEADLRSLFSSQIHRGTMMGALRTPTFTPGSWCVDFCEHSQIGQESERAGLNGHIQHAALQAHSCRQPRCNLPLHLISSHHPARAGTAAFPQVPAACLQPPVPSEGNNAPSAKEGSVLQNTQERILSSSLSVGN